MSDVNNVARTVASRHLNGTSSIATVLVILSWYVVMRHPAHEVELRRLISPGQDRSRSGFASLLFQRRREYLHVQSPSYFDREEVSSREI